MFSMPEFASFIVSLPLAAAGQGESTSALEGILQMVPLLILFFALLYVMTIRPQQKQQKKMQELNNSLKAGDKVVTTGGIVGTISEVQDEFVKIEISEGVHMTFVRASVRDRIDEAS
jgi:preprotein translocase subunit YajC